MLDREAVLRLATIEADHAVSIYLPTEIRGAEVRQNPLRLKNLVSEAQTRLVEEEGMAEGHAERLLETAKKLAEADPSGEFWAYQDHGLALFMADDTFEAVKLPRPVEEGVYLGRRLHLKPLLPILTGQEQFYLLAFTQQHVALYQGDAEGLRELADDELPETFHSRIKQRYLTAGNHFHPTGPTPTTHGTTAQNVHAGGESAKDHKTLELSNYVRDLAHAVDEIMADKQAPLIVVCDKQVIGDYRAHARYNGLVGEGIAHNPQNTDADALHDLAWGQVAPRLVERREQATNRVAAFRGGEADKLSEEIGRLVEHASQGRVEMLFVPADQHIWGVVDGQSGRAVAHHHRQPGDVDLLDIAAIEALQNGGEVYALKDEHMPVDSGGVAILRY